MAYNSHGNTPAAWTTVAIIMAGFIVGAAGVILMNWPLFWIGGVGLVVVGAVVGKVMQMMGLGQIDTLAAKSSRETAGSGSVHSEDSSG